MRNPHRNRTIGLLFFATGLAGMALLSQLPKERVENNWLGIVLILYAPNAILFGGGSALFSHFKLRAKNALLRGEDVIARWRVDPSTWIEFTALDNRLNQEPGARINELSIRGTVPAKGIEVIVGKAAVQIDDSIHLLPPRGSPEVTEASLRTDGPTPFYIEVSLYHPPRGGGTTLFHPGRYSALRFPIPTGVEREAEAVVKTYNGPRGDPDFFHGRGDGSNLEDLSKCRSCGYETHKFISHCPRCGKGLQSRRWSRRLGGILFACGLFISAIMGAVLYYTAPLLLHPGVEVNGTRFSGTADQGLLFLGILGAVAAFGIISMLYGLWQIKTGRRSTQIISSLIVLCASFWLVAQQLK